MERDNLKKNTFVDIGRMKLIAEYRCLVSAQIVKIYTETYENEKHMFKVIQFACVLTVFSYLYLLIRAYFYAGTTIIFGKEFIFMTVFYFIVLSNHVYIRYFEMINSKKKLDYAITGYNEWKWIFEQAKLEPLANSKEMNQLQERFQTCHSIYKFSMTREDRQTIDELV